MNVTQINASKYSHLTLGQLSDAYAIRFRQMTAADWRDDDAGDAILEDALALATMIAIRVTENRQHNLAQYAPARPAPAKPAHHIKVWRESVRGWHAFPATACINVNGNNGPYVSAKLRKTDKGWEAFGECRGREYRAEGRRQIDAATALADRIASDLASRTPLLDSIVVELPA